MKYFSVFVLFWLLFFPGCIQNIPEQNAALSCEAMSNVPFHEFIGKPLDTDRALQIIESTYDVPKEKISVLTYPNINEWSEVISWEKDGASYFLQWKQDNLQVLFIEFSKDKPDIQSLLQCENVTPEWYRAIYGPRRERSGIDFYFELWFPSIGLVTQSRGDASSTDDLPRLSPDFPIDNIHIVAPGSIKQIYDNMGFGSGYLPPERQYELKPWPDSWGDIRYDKGW